MVNHDSLRWQFQYGGLKLINLRLLVCPECYDEPQIQLRTIILPPDPPTIEFPLPEPYPDADNPNSPIGFSLHGPAFGANIGTLTSDGGLDAAFDGNIRKKSQYCATGFSSTAGTQTIGKAWNAPISNSNLPASITTTVTYDIVSFSIYAPLDAGFMFAQPAFGPAFGPAFDLNASGPVPAAIQLQGSNDNTNWTVLYSGTTVGTVGEAFTVTAGIAAGNFQSHRIAISGSGAVRVAQVQFNVLTTGQNEE